MAITLGNNLIQHSTLNRINHTSNNLARQISSGTKHPSAVFGPSAYSIDMRMNANIAAVSQSDANSQRTNAMLKTAEGGVSSSVEALGQLQQTLLNAANGTNSDSDRRDLGKMVDQTIATLNDNAGIQYNGMNLLDGSKSANVASLDGSTSITNLGDMRSSALGLTDANGKSTLNLGTDAGIADALDKVTTALNKTLDQATTIGAAQQRLNYQSANFVTQEENLMAASTTSNGTDMAKAASEFKNSDTQQKLFLFAQKAQMSTMASHYSALALLR
ncbi:flagellin [uncultured Selenomonas sp.]|uniref:flagellin n=1 Tax=uncultured Selenomonas sp. TaxID=159275 RepID=UPI0028E4A8A2|nr:flagellin [uncultured Selenomonas sp.]